MSKVQSRKLSQTLTLGIGLSTPSAEHRQIIKRQLGVINRFGEFAMADSGPRHVQRFSNSVEMKTNYVGRDANGRNAPFAGKPSHRCLAHLQHLRKLASGKEFLAIFHVSE